MTDQIMYTILSGCIRSTEHETQSIFLYNQTMISHYGKHFQVIKKSATPQQRLNILITTGRNKFIFNI